MLRSTLVNLIQNPFDLLENSLSGTILIIYVDAGNDNISRLKITSYSLQCLLQKRAHLRLLDLTIRILRVCTENLVQFHWFASLLTR